MWCWPPKGFFSSHLPTAESAAVGWPKHYVEDLTFHDRRYCAELDASEPFAWVLRECGTHMVHLEQELLKRRVL